MQSALRCKEANDSGVLLFYVPASLRGDDEPTHQQDTSNGNHYMDNVMGKRPNGKADRNGVDFKWDGAGEGNCAEGNKGPGGAATMAPNSLPKCANASPIWLPGDGTTVPLMASCASWDPKSMQRPPGCDWFYPRRAVALAATANFRLNPRIAMAAILAANVVILVIALSGSGGGGLSPSSALAWDSAPKVIRPADLPHDRSPSGRSATTACGP